METVKRPKATRRQINAIAAHLVYSGKADIDEAGWMASGMVEAAGYDMSNFYTVGDIARADARAHDLVAAIPIE